MKQEARPRWLAPARDRSKRISEPQAKRPSKLPQRKLEGEKTAFNREIEAPLGERKRLDERTKGRDPMGRKRSRFC